jgi:prolyl 4-hydroxylase
LYRHFMTRAECEHFIAAATPSMAKSTVVDSATGKSVDSQIRTSSGTFLRRSHDEVVADVERRIAEFSMVPEEHGEGVQILRYEKGQKYEAHYDYFHDKFNADPAKGGQRVATLLMYLTDVEEGGETVFPASADKPHAAGGSDSDGWSECAKRGIAVKPRQGDALLFFSLDLEQQLDTASLHAGCPVVRGVKWSATKWMHVGAFGQEAKARKGCNDYNTMCEEWARAGECTRNAAYMVGADGSQGECLKSCKKCKA